MLAAISEGGSVLLDELGLLFPLCYRYWWEKHPQLVLGRKFWWQKQTRKSARFNLKIDGCRTLKKTNQNCSWCSSWESPDWSPDSRLWNVQDLGWRFESSLVCWFILPSSSFIVQICYGTVLDWSTDPGLSPPINPDPTITLDVSVCQIVRHLGDPGLPLSALLLQPPEELLFCRPLPYLRCTYREEGGTGTAHRNSRIHTSKWIIQVAKSNGRMQPLPVTGDERLFSQQSQRFRISFVLMSDLIRMTLMGTV